MRRFIVVERLSLNSHPGQWKWLFLPAICPRPPNLQTDIYGFLPIFHFFYLITGNPFYDGLSPEQQRVEVLKKLPQLAKIDGVMVTPAERAEAAE